MNFRRIRSHTKSNLIVIIIIKVALQGNDTYTRSVVTATGKGRNACVLKSGNCEYRGRANDSIKSDKCFYGISFVKMLTDTRFIWQTLWMAWRSAFISFSLKLESLMCFLVEWIYQTIIMHVSFCQFLFRMNWTTLK